MKVLVSGARGQLGGELLAELARRGHEGVATARRAPGVIPLDITDVDAVRRLLEEQRPDAVVNCAGWTKVDAAESDPEGAYRANATGPRVLADACHAVGAHLVQVSTDYVFSRGAGPPIDERTPPCPVGQYGRSKLAGEEEVRSLCARHAVARTSWLYGRAGPNFVLTILRLARERGEVAVVADQVGSPTWTGHLAPALVRLVERGTLGTVHLSNTGAVSWHGFATEIMAAAGLDVPVRAITTAELRMPAPRPAYSALDDRAWRLLGEAPLPDWRDGLRAYLTELGENAASEKKRAP